MVEHYTQWVILQMMRSQPIPMPPFRRLGNARLEMFGYTWSTDEGQELVDQLCPKIKASGESTYLLPCLLLIPETTEHSTSHSSSSGLLNTSHRHTHMANLSALINSEERENVLSFHDDCYTPWSNRFVDCKSHLFSQSLLDLKSPGEGLGDSCQFG
jgi:hypothetical protein